jgi:monoamine oxidase
MSRTELFARFRRSVRLASYCEEEGVGTAEGLERRTSAELQGRRSFLGSLGAIGAAAATGTLAQACSIEAGSTTGALTHVGALDVGIVGAGLAGLVCADELRQNGVTATVYEANDRVGGRQWSQRGAFPGQTIERGGELIDTSQRSIINYARSFGLTLESYLREPGETFYYLNGARVPESQIVDSLRAFIGVMRDDVRQLSAAPSAAAHNDFDVLMDGMSIDQYLRSRGADATLYAAIQAAYVGEYGREITDQSALNFLLYIRADRRSKFEPFGTSDQRYHIVEGNDAVAQGLAARLPGQIQLGMALTSIARAANGRYTLTFRSGGRTVTRTHDYVVIAIPFSVLRTLTLDASLGLPDWKLRTIREFGYGQNSKNMVGFSARPWAAQGNNGMVYATLPNLQNSWETSWTTSTSSTAVVTNFTGGALGASQDPSRAQAQTAAFVADLDTVVPGAAAAASRDASGNYVQSMTAWPRVPTALGSYSCYRPGQFTSIAGTEATPIGRLYFAGEHCNSFYDQQGFMEGAIHSGADTSAAILGAARAGV